MNECLSIQTWAVFGGDQLLPNVCDSVHKLFVAGQLCLHTRTGCARIRIVSAACRCTRLTARMDSRCGCYQAGQLVLINSLVGGPVSMFLAGPYVAGEASFLSFTFRDEFFNTRYQGEDISLNDLSLVVYPPEESGLDTEVVAPTMEFVPEGDSPHKGKYMVRFNVTRAGVMRILLNVLGDDLTNSTTGNPYEVIIAPSPAVVRRPAYQDRARVFVNPEAMSNMASD